MVKYSLFRMMNYVLGCELSPPFLYWSCLAVTIDRVVNPGEMVSWQGYSNTWTSWRMLGCKINIQMSRTQRKLQWAHNHLQYTYTYMYVKYHSQIENSQPLCGCAHKREHCYPTCSNCTMHVLCPDNLFFGLVCGWGICFFPRFGNWWGRVCAFELLCSRGI